MGGGVQLALRKFGLGEEAGQLHGAGELQSRLRCHVSPFFPPPYPILQKIPLSILSKCFQIPHISHNPHLYCLNPSRGHLSPETTCFLVPLPNSYPPELHPSSAARAIHTAPRACKVLQNLASVTSLRTGLPLLAQAFGHTTSCL